MEKIMGTIPVPLNINILKSVDLGRLSSGTYPIRKLCTKSNILHISTTNFSFSAESLQHKHALNVYVKICLTTLEFKSKELKNNCLGLVMPEILNIGLFETFGPRKT